MRFGSDSAGEKASALHARPAAQQRQGWVDFKTTGVALSIILGCFSTRSEARARMSTGLGFTFLRCKPQEPGMNEYQQGPGAWNCAAQTWRPCFRQAPRASGCTVPALRPMTASEVTIISCTKEKNEQILLQSKFFVFSRKGE
jgi:hypothetical protein